MCFRISPQSSWEANNTNERPWQGLRLEAWEIPDAFGYDDTQPTHFYERSTDSDGQQQTRPLDPAVRDDRFKILAFAAQSYGRAVGADPVDIYFDLAAKDGFDPSFNLAGDPTGFGKTHYEHDAQFMYDIQQRWPYWQTLLSSLGFTPAPWSRP